jgi:hypothetical protein
MILFTLTTKTLFLSGRLLILFILEAFIRLLGFCFMTRLALPYLRWDLDARQPFFRAWGFVAGKDCMEQGCFKGSD